MTIEARIRELGNRHRSLDEVIRVSEYLDTDPDAAVADVQAGVD